MLNVNVKSFIHMMTEPCLLLCASLGNHQAGRIVSFMPYCTNLDQG